ncbi:DMT family transporter [Bacteroides sp.]|uniref:DMT family transporter n=1 Tax=Bacteroides sp. TaxID=29523 RepID=UPI0023C24086|nr:DMT family transporter [Bacteroides sp.]MDE6215309.1 DMT family transporter [Bacteroides sp.]
MKDNTSSVFYACIAVLSWSTVATAFKIALMHLTHFEMLLVASCTSLVIFTLLITVRKKWKEVAELSGKQWGYFAMLGLLNPVAYYLVLFKAYDLLPAQVAQPVNYIWPIMLLILLALFAHQPIPAKKYIGMFISLSGVALISIGTGQSEGMNLSVFGLLLAFLSSLLWAMYWMINNKFKDKTDGSVALFMSFLFGTGYLLIGAAVVGVNLHTLPGILSGMYVGGFEMGIPFIFFSLAMRKTTNPALINQLCYLSPFLSLFFIALILGEQIVLATYIGLALIVTGIMFNEYLVRK